MRNIESLMRVIGLKSNYLRSGCRKQLQFSSNSSQAASATYLHKDFIWLHASLRKPMAPDDAFYSPISHLLFLCGIYVAIMQPLISTTILRLSNYLITIILSDLILMMKIILVVLQKLLSCQYVETISKALWKKNKLNF